jgi:endoglucanase
MRPESLEFLKELVDAPSPSGFEQPAQRVIRRYLKPYADDVTTDVMGNVIAVLNPTGRPRLMLAGHCDEIGLMVRYITDEGFLHFAPIGGVDPHLVTGQRVQIHGRNGAVLGVVGKKAIHLMESDERTKVLQFHQQWIDIGAANREEAESKVAIGDPMTFTDTFEPLLGDFATARGFDDKMGSWVCAETLRLAKERGVKACVIAVSTVQEEIGLRGAHTSAYSVEPDVAIAVDVGHSTDYPDSEKKRVGDVKLGKGPKLHRGANINAVVADRLFAAAKKADIPYQLTAIPGGSGTDAWAMQLARGGVATGLVSVPLRYMHTPIEVINLKDLEAAAELLAAFAADLPEDISFIPE